MNDHDLPQPDDAIGAAPPRIVRVTPPNFNVYDADQHRQRLSHKPSGYASPQPNRSAVEPPVGARARPVIFDFKPYHALRILIALWVVLALLFLPGIEFWTSAMACGYAEWYTRTRKIGWPAGVEELLDGRRLAMDGTGGPSDCVDLDDVVEQAVISSAARAITKLRGLVA